MKAEDSPEAVGAVDWEYGEDVIDESTYDFVAKPVEDVEYNREARQVERARDVYRSKRVSRPSYTRPDPEGTVRIENFVPGRDQVTFPVIRKNQLARLEEDEIVSDSGTLWRLQRAIADAKFNLLKKCINDAHHMVSDITATVVIEVSAKTLTDKAGAVVRVKDHVETVTLLLPNGEFDFGQR